MTPTLRGSFPPLLTAGFFVLAVWTWWYVDQQVHGIMPSVVCVMMALIGILAGLTLRFTLRLQAQSALLRAAHEELQERTEDLERAHGLYKSLVRNLPNTSVFLFDHEYRHLVAEGSLLTGITIPPNYQRRLSLREVFPVDLATEIRPYYWQVFNEQQPVRMEQAYRGRIYRFQFLPLFSNTGQVALGMAVALDITDATLREQALENAIADLERSNRDLEQFADVASHEMKSPLRRISSFAELLSEDYEGLLSDEADEYLGHITEGVHEMANVIEALLTFSRAKTLEERMEPVDFNELFDHTVRGLCSRIKDVGGEVYREKLPTVYGDPVLLKQLLENLIWNGLKFSKENPVVRVSAHRDLLEWVFSVSDNGPGVDPAHFERIFQMFKRSRTDVEGHGVGLALCRKIVNIHRGKIWVVSPPGEGATFQFSMPAKHLPSPVSLPPFEL